MDLTSLAEAASHAPGILKFGSGILSKVNSDFGVLLERLCASLCFQQDNSFSVPPFIIPSIATATKGCLGFCIIVLHLSHVVYLNKFLTSLDY